MNDPRRRKADEHEVSEVGILGYNREISIVGKLSDLVIKPSRVDVVDKQVLL